MNFLETLKLEGVDVILRKLLTITILKKDLHFTNLLFSHKQARVNGVVNINPRTTLMEIHLPHRNADTPAVVMYCVTPSGERVPESEILAAAQKIIDYNNSANKSKPVQLKPREKQQETYLEGMK